MLSFNSPQHLRMTMSAIHLAAKKLIGQIAEIQDDRARLKEQLGISERERLVRIFKFDRMV